MRHRRTTVALLASLIAVCSSAPAATAHPRVSVQQPLDLCASLTSETAQQLQQAYRQRYQQFIASIQSQIAPAQSTADVRQAIGKLGECVQLEPIRGGGGHIFSVALKDVPFFYGPSALIHHTVSRWRGLPLGPDEAFADYVLPKAVVHDRDGARVLAERLSVSTGHFGQALLYRLGEEPQVEWESPRYWMFGMRILRPDLLLITYRPNENRQEPHYFFANCCMPTDGQTLMQRRGSGYAQVASRTYPNPFRAVSLFVGALQKGELAVAEQWATSPAVVQAGHAVAAQLKPEGTAPGRAAVEKAEAMYWTALPRPLQGPKPTAVRIVWPAGTYDLVVVRTPDRWQVAEVRPKKR